MAFSTRFVSHFADSPDVLAFTDFSALASAIIGKTPLYGLLLDENRLGTLQVNINFIPSEAYDWGLLGWYVGMHVGNEVPVLQFPDFPAQPRPEDLLYFGAEANTSGAVPMFHIVGVTPEAPTLETAFGTNIAKSTLNITTKDLAEIERKLSDEPGDINMVMLGCPHYTYGQVCEIENLLAGRQVIIPFWVLVSDTTLTIAKRSGKQQSLELSGVNLVAGTCVDQPCFKSFEDGMFITDSPKAAYYREGRGQKGFLVRRLSDCIEAAIKGRV